VLLESRNVCGTNLDNEGDEKMANMVKKFKKKPILALGLI